MIALSVLAVTFLCFGWERTIWIDPNNFAFGLYVLGLNYFLFHCFFVLLLLKMPPIEIRSQTVFYLTTWLLGRAHFTLTIYILHLFSDHLREVVVSHTELENCFVICRSLKVE